MAQALIEGINVIGVMDCDTPSVLEQAVINTEADKCVPIGNLLVQAGDTYEEVNISEANSFTFTRFEFRRNGGQVPVYRTPEQIVMDNLIADGLAKDLEITQMKEVLNALVLDSLVVE